MLLQKKEKEKIKINNNNNNNNNNTLITTTIEKYLVAYIVIKKDNNNNNNNSNNNDNINTSLLRQFLKKRLPDYMIPSFFIIIDKLPLTPNGKVDRKLLPDPVTDKQQKNQSKEFENENDKKIIDSFIEPTNEIEFKLVEIWKQLLGGLEKISINDNFFELGGDSIMTVQLVSRIKIAFSDISKSIITIKQIFEYPTISKLSSLILLNKKITNEFSTIQTKISNKHNNYFVFKKQNSLLLPLSLQKFHNENNENNQMIVFQLHMNKNKLLIPFFQLENIFQQLIVHHNVFNIKFIGNKNNSYNNDNIGIRNNINNSDNHNIFYQILEKHGNNNNTNNISYVPFHYLNLLKFNIINDEYNNIYGKIQSVFEKEIKKIKKSLDIFKGPLFRYITFIGLSSTNLQNKFNNQTLTIIFIIHNLMVDKIPLDLFINDFQNACYYFQQKIHNNNNNR